MKKYKVTVIYQEPYIIIMEATSRKIAELGAKAKIEQIKEQDLPYMPKGIKSGKINYKVK